MPKAQRNQILLNAKLRNKSTPLAAFASCWQLWQVLIAVNWFKSLLKTVKYYRFYQLLTVFTYCRQQKKRIHLSRFPRQAVRWQGKAMIRNHIFSLDNDEEEEKEESILFFFLLLNPHAEGSQLAVPGFFLAWAQLSLALWYATPPLCTALWDSMLCILL